MCIIDAHAHITSSWEELGIVRDVADSVRLMDRYDIEISFSSDSRALRGDYVAANDRLLDAMARFPGRICGYAVANPWDGQAGLDGSIQQGCPGRDFDRCIKRKESNFKPGIRRQFPTPHRNW